MGIFNITGDLTEKVENKLAETKSIERKSSDYFAEMNQSAKEKESSNLDTKTIMQAQAESSSKQLRKEKLKESDSYRYYEEIIPADLNQNKVDNNSYGLTDIIHAKLLLVGVGGCGGNAITRAIESGITNIDFLAINTDVQDLNQLPKIVRKIQIGESGLGAGGLAESARKSAMDKINLIQDLIEPYDAIFLVAGLGGGTGSGAAPAIAQMIAEREDKLLIASVTEPFDFEGTHRMNQAKQALDEISSYVDSLIVVPNEKIMDTDPELGREDAFKFSDEVLSNAINSITYTIHQNGAINVDFNDVKTVLKAGSCQSYIGQAQSTGENRIKDVVEKAFSFITINDLENCHASSALIILTSTKDSPIKECRQVKEFIKDKIKIENEANVIFGMYDLVDGSFNPDNPHVELSVIISGIEDKNYPYQATESLIIDPSVDLQSVSRLAKQEGFKMRTETNSAINRTQMRIKERINPMNKNFNKKNMGPLFEEKKKPGSPAVLDAFSQSLRLEEFSINKDAFAS